MLIKLKQKPNKNHTTMKALSQLKKNPPADFETQSKAEKIKLQKYPGNPFSPHLRNKILVWNFVINNT